MADSRQIMGFIHDLCNIDYEKKRSLKHFHK